MIEISYIKCEYFRVKISFKSSENSWIDNDIDRSTSLKVEEEKLARAELVFQLVKPGIMPHIKL